MLTPTHPDLQARRGREKTFVQSARFVVSSALFLMKINASLTPAKLSKKTARVFELAGEKIRALDAAWDPSKGTPVFTVAGKYSSRGWTEWTQGFQFGMANSGGGRFEGRWTHQMHHPRHD